MGIHLSGEIFFFFSGFSVLKSSENSSPGVEQPFINITVGLIALPAPKLLLKSPSNQSAHALIQLISLSTGVPFLQWLFLQGERRNV